MHAYQLSDFTIIKQLGKGGFGSAYLALRNSDEMQLCLKVVPLQPGVSQEEILREAKMLSQLNSEHIIKYYGSFVESGTFFIVMEYAARGSLDDMIRVCHYDITSEESFCL